MGFSCSSENSRRIRAAGCARVRARPRRFRPLDDGRLRGTLNRRRSRDKIAHFESPYSPLPRPPRIGILFRSSGLLFLLPRLSLRRIHRSRSRERRDNDNGGRRASFGGPEARVAAKGHDDPAGRQGLLLGASAREIFIPREEGGRPAFRRLRFVCCRRIYSDPVRGIFPRDVASARGEGSG